MLGISSLGVSLLSDINKKSNAIYFILSLPLSLEENIIYSNILLIIQSMMKRKSK